MNLDNLKMFIKKHPRLDSFLFIISNISNKEICKDIIGLKRNPYLIKIDKCGLLNPENLIYFINFDENYSVNGFCSLYRSLLLQLSYADDLNFLPVVYWGENNLYFDEEFKDSSNVFEYYFKPLNDITVDEVLNSKHVIVSKPANENALGTAAGYKFSDDEMRFLSVVNKKYIKLNDRILTYFGDIFKKTLSHKVLGVHVRATDFNKGYNRHPVVVTPYEYLEATKKVADRYDYIFLATDDEKVCQLFISEFKDKLIYYKDTYRSKDGEAIHYGNENVKRPQHKYLLGMEILRDFYTLGYCTGLIAGHSNVSVCARIIRYSQESYYDYVNIIDKGINHNMHETRSIFKPMIKK